MCTSSKNLPIKDEKVRFLAYHTGVQYSFNDVVLILTGGLCGVPSLSIVGYYQRQCGIALLFKIKTLKLNTGKNECTPKKTSG